MSSESFYSGATELMRFAQTHLGDFWFGVAAVSIALALLYGVNAALKGLGSFVFTKAFPYLIKGLAARIGVKGALVAATLIGGWVGLKQIAPEQVEQLKTVSSELAPEKLAKSENPMVRQTGTWLTSLSPTQTAGIACAAGFLLALSINRRSAASAKSKLGENEFREPSGILATRFVGLALLIWPVAAHVGYLFAYDCGLFESAGWQTYLIVANYVCSIILALFNLNDPKKTVVMAKLNVAPILCFAVGTALLTSLFLTRGQWSEEFTLQYPSVSNFAYYAMKSIGLVGGALGILSGIICYDMHSSRLGIELAKSFPNLAASLEDDSGKPVKSLSPWNDDLTVNQLQATIYKMSCKTSNS